ncbi:MAG: hypothetical protein ACRDN0_34670 [Trebonia sp.]
MADAAPLSVRRIRGQERAILRLADAVVASQRDKSLLVRTLADVTAPKAERHLYVVR